MKQRSGGSEHIETCAVSNPLPGVRITAPAPPVAIESQPQSLVPEPMLDEDGLPSGAGSERKHGLTFGAPGQASENWEE